MEEAAGSGWPILWTARLSWLQSRGIVCTAGCRKTPVRGPDSHQRGKEPSVKHPTGVKLVTSLPILSRPSPPPQ